MNMVSCGEDCRYQTDGCCTRGDLAVSGAVKVSRPSASAANGSKCCYFEQR